MKRNQVKNVIQTKKRESIEVVNTHTTSLRKENGITLIALVITIIVLLILAGVTIAALSGDNGILQRASETKEQTQIQSEEELRRLTQMEAAMNLKNIDYYDSKGNKAIIPEGFAVSQVEGEQEIDTGLVIVDSEGNEFVWIPVGDVAGDDGIEKIELNRYSFEEDGTANPMSGKYIEENSRDTENLLNYGNIIATDIENFKESVQVNGGYYIARYEASYRDGIKPYSKKSTGYLVEDSAKYEGILWNWITQSEASRACQQMYNSDNFTSDLVNSYAWDTAIVYIQSFSNPIYSMQTSTNDNLLNTGETGDKECNIYDMASNIRSWSTETYNDSSNPCVSRGGIFNNSQYYTAKRRIAGTDSKYVDVGFRVIIYIN